MSSREVKFTVLRPVAKERARIQTRRGGRPLARPHGYTPKATEGFEKRVGHEALVALCRAGGGAFAGGVAVELWLYLTRNDRDADNVAKSVLDGCEGVLYENDLQVLDLEVHKRPALDGVDPSVHVTVRESSSVMPFPPARGGARAAR